MNVTKNIIEIPGFIQNKIHKRIIFTDEGITIEKPLSFDPPTFINAENINAFRYGVNWRRGYWLIIGRQYFIQVQDHEKNMFSIKLTSYYRIRNKAYHKAWSDIFNALWHNFFVNMFYYYRDLYNIRQEFELAGVKFNSTGITWRDDFLKWNEIALNNYRTYFSIHHKNDTKSVKHCRFASDWNAFILQHLLKQIVEEHKMYKPFNV